MPERRYTEEEVRRVFAAVAERQSRAAAPEAGLSLAEMQEAAEASGLDPALVAAVVAEMASGEPDEIPAFLGAPLAVRKTRVLPIEIDDAVWTRIVAELRRAFDTPGMPTDLGTQREWTSSTGTHGTPVHLTAIPGDGTTVVTLEQTIAKHSEGAGKIIPLAVIPMAMLSAFFYFVGGLGAEVWWLPVLVGAVVSLIVVALWAMWRSWASRTDARFDRVLDRVEIAARDAALASGPAVPSGTARPAPEALGLDALPDAPDTDAAPRTRTRDRS